MVILLNWVNSSGEYLLDRTLLAAARQATASEAGLQVFIGAFKADYYVWYNSIGVGLQLFAVSRVLRVVGVRGALSVLPSFALLAYGTAMFFPVLAVMRWVKIGENSLQYSLQDTTRNALFLAASRVEKFVGQTAVDTVAVRIRRHSVGSHGYVWQVLRLVDGHLRNDQRRSGGGVDLVRGPHRPGEPTAQRSGNTCARRAAGRFLTTEAVPSRVTTCRRRRAGTP